MYATCTDHYCELTKLEKFAYFTCVGRCLYRKLNSQDDVIMKQILVNFSRSSNTYLILLLLFMKLKINFAFMLYLTPYYKT